jgi:hypothetical protein
VTLRGNESEVISALAKEIQEIVDKENTDVYGMHISQKYHSMLQTHLRSVEQSTRTTILLPDRDHYDDYADPINAHRLRMDEANMIVKIIGTPDAFRQARSELDVSFLECGPSFVQLTKTSESHR